MRPSSDTKFCTNVAKSLAISPFDSCMWLCGVASSPFVEKTLEEQPHPTKLDPCLPITDHKPKSKKAKLQLQFIKERVDEYLVWSLRAKLVSM